MTRSDHRFHVVLFGLLGLLLVTGSVAFAQPRVVVSIHPYLDLTQRVAGPDVTVVRLLPPGASPHGFDPTPAVVAEVERADLVVFNGGSDAWVLDLVESGANAPAVLEILSLFPEVHGTDPTEEDPTHADDHEGDAHGHANSHVWLDPVLMERAVEALGERLAELDPEHADRYRRNAATVASELRALHAEIAETLAPVRGEAFVPFHDAWPYFAARYGLDLVIEIEPFPGREPSPRYLAEVIAAIREHDARVVFAEAQLGERPARVIASEAGVGIAVLDPIGGTDGRMSYEDLLRYNARTIADALRAP